MPGTRRTAEWTVRVVIDGDDHRARAKAVLFAENATRLSAKGFARRNPTDGPVAMVGDTLATARAMQQLAEKLMQAAWKSMRTPSPTTSSVVALPTKRAHGRRLPGGSPLSSGQGAG